MGWVTQFHWLWQRINAAVSWVPEAMEMEFLSLGWGRNCEMSLDHWGQQAQRTWRPGRGHKVGTAVTCAPTAKDWTEMRTSQGMPVYEDTELTGCLPSTRWHFRSSPTKEIKIDGSYHTLIDLASTMCRRQIESRNWFIFVDCYISLSPAMLGMDGLGPTLFPKGPIKEAHYQSRSVLYLKHQISNISWLWGKGVKMAAALGTHALLSYEG